MIRSFQNHIDPPQIPVFKRGAAGFISTQYRTAEKREVIVGLKTVPFAPTRSGEHRQLQPLQSRRCWMAVVEA